MRFYKHDITAWMDGTESLSLEEYRAYHVICQLIYLGEEPITRNERSLAARCGIHILSFRSALNSLITKGKIFVTDDERLHNHRAETELADVGFSHEKRSAAGKKSGEARRLTSIQPQGNLDHTSGQPTPGSPEVEVRSSLGSGIVEANTPTFSTKTSNTCSNRLDHTRQDETRLFNESELVKKDDERPVLRPNDFASDDGSLIISSEEFDALGNRFPSVKNIRGLARHACRSWLLTIKPTDRKQVFFNWLRKKNDEPARAPRAPSARSSPDHDQRMDEVFAAEKARRAQNDRALELRRELSDRAKKREQEQSNGGADASRRELH